MHKTPIELLLANLDGSLNPRIRRGRLNPEEAHARLVSATGQDFGYDSAAWRKWLSENPERWRLQDLLRPP